MVVGVLIGIVIWLLFELNKAFDKPEFSYEKFIRLNIVPFLLNLSCGLAVLWFRDDISDLFVVTKFSSVMLGMSGQAIFKRFVGIFDRKIGTKLGRNEKNNV